MKAHKHLLDVGKTSDTARTHGMELLKRLGLVNKREMHDGIDHSDEQGEIRESPHIDRKDELWREPARAEAS